MLLVLTPFYLALENQWNFIRHRKEKRKNRGRQRTENSLSFWLLCGLANCTCALHLLVLFHSLGDSAAHCHLRSTQLKGSNQSLPSFDLRSLLPPSQIFQAWKELLHIRKGAWLSLKVLDLPAELTQMLCQPSQRAVIGSLSLRWRTRKPILCNGLNGCLIHSGLFFAVVVGICLFFPRKYRAKLRPDLSEGKFIYLRIIAVKPNKIMISLCLEACSGCFPSLWSCDVLSKHFFECTWNRIYVY